MKKFIFALLLASSQAYSATVIFEDGSQVEVPDDWAWSIKMQVKAPQKQCPPSGPPQHCPPVHCPPVPPPVECPTLCDLDPYRSGCPLACDGETPGSRCRRQRDEFTGP